MRNKRSWSEFTWRAVRAAFRCVRGLIIFAAANHCFANDWQFVLPQPGAEHEHPPLRAVPLAAEKPDDLKEKAEYRGDMQEQNDGIECHLCLRFD